MTEQEVVSRSSSTLSRFAHKFTSPLKSTSASPTVSTHTKTTVYEKKSPTSSSTSQSSKSSKSSTGRSPARSGELKRQERGEKLLRRQEEERQLEERRRREYEEARRAEDDETRARYGEGDETEYPTELTTIGEAVKLDVGTKVTFRARIHTQRNISKHLDFILFRDQTDTIQGVLADTTPNMVKWVQRLHPESIVQVSGTLQKPLQNVKSAHYHDIEVDVHSIHLLNPAKAPPFSNYLPPDSMNFRMNNRILDLRHPSNQALFRVRAMITRKFRETLDNSGFIEIQTPKLQPAATESGAEVFKLNYFGRRAFLAQSPQLAKQMAISADFGKVYEIGPVFRAENSNTHRHLTEYTGLDIEMKIHKHYHEIIKVLDQTLKNIFAAVHSMPELKIIRERFPSEDLVWLDETPIIPFPEGLQMLRDDGRDVADEDLSTPDEIRLGELVKEKYGTDYYILDKFPANARPFYTHKAEDPFWTNSFDIFVRGQEICTGGQRINDPEELRKNMAEKGISEDDMAEYLTAFDLGAPPHGGAGLGLDRVVFLLLNLGDVRYGTLFYRDPKSLPSRSFSLPHPAADTTKAWAGKELPPLEELIANYGDASNTSWLDERFEIWRHGSGAAVGYVKQGKFAMITGDPLCDRGQYEEVIPAFVEFVTKELKLTPVWMLVSNKVQEILGRRIGWRTMSCTVEQRADADQHTTPDGRAARRVKREGIKVHELKPDEDFMRRADQSIEAWKEKRKGKKQVHLTEIRPWIDQAHRRYFAAEKDGKVLCMVVLAQLAPRHGWQVKWALDFPDAPNGTIEVLVEYALSCISGPVTFGVGVSDRFVPGEHLHGVRAKFLSKTYAGIVKSLGLGKKAEFRDKFGVLGEQVYICYPRRGVTLFDLKEIVKFFTDEEQAK
ncbi:aspartyl-tRNA synthetase [Colletotrichum higginsianum]|uniref:Probable aspartate--tRNA ligase, cytoplasmic n=2 Tax=Colletotrichum higginsianum TaxID=80884 RepID=H1UW60_COLHI|nr:Aspartyl-tRNA synthetase [Colletotrichum higginsianum IMI 349063]OBR16253.1 Aspartyl-tRNA synthetase [Colletotrichum higginsianum IMI 349063]TID05017.1 Aspartate--tRNA ligase, cytoplasmic [Colletotrichum higginsianum]GJC91499.1 aspartyl-tRNA synthetase [Colletotrichum higginsianum]CCF32211.1 aspartyl-tRNA synthetase [Colletotrichum higginsianum]